jgi:hypothetical protein
VNEVSREFPKLRLICPGGFILGKGGVEELIVLDGASDAQTEAVVDYLKARKTITSVELVERGADKAYIMFTNYSSLPKEFCSKVVERNRGFRIGMEIQHEGLETWHVGCADRGNAERMIEEISRLGRLKHSSISEESWAKLLNGDQS